MTTIDFLIDPHLDRASIADDESPELVAAFVRDLSSTRVLLRQALAREAVLRRERDQLIELRGIASKLFAGREDAALRVARLTARQREIMGLLLLGHQNKQIAAKIGISQRTVESHRAAIMKRTGATCLPELARLALAAGR